MKGYSKLLSLKRSLGMLLLAALFFVACTPSHKSGYKITGTVEGATAGTIVYLEEITDIGSKVLAKAQIQDGAFTIEGVQDSVKLCYLSCNTDDEVYSLPFFLENGEISVSMVRHDSRITGTEHNDLYQVVRDKVNAQVRRMNEIHDDSTLTEEEKDLLFDEADIAYDQAFKDGMKDNITNPVGIHIFKEKYYENSLSENLALMSQIPSEYMTDPVLLGIQQQLAHQEKTDVSRPFTDLEMKTPEGKAVKLSDYVGKGKPVLVDFWASWCGPCRQSMPELISLYKEFDGKLEIVGVSFDEDHGAWQKAITRLELPWPQMSDLLGWKSLAAKEYGIHSIPHTVLIDQEGTIVARELSGEDLAKAVRELVSKK